MHDDLTVDYPITTHTLDNGMRVVLSRDELVPGTAVNLWYHVGSGDEDPQATGFAHLFEHLMFCGSANVANSEHLPLVQKLGGSANATTSFDRTNYFETVPTGAFELMCWLEADRLASLDVSQLNLDTQREVVKEEKRQSYDNRPYGDLLALLLELSFPDAHPYHHPTIGSMADLDAATLDQVRAFHSRWYTPSNAVLTVVGPTPDDEALELVNRHFGALRSGPAPEHSPTAGLAPHTGIPTLDVTRLVPRTSVQLTWRTPSLTAREQVVLQVICALLTTGQSSRLMTGLVKNDELADHVSAFDFELARTTSATVVSAMAREGVEPERLAAGLLDAVTALAATGPTPAELDRVHAQIEREWFQHLASIDARADAIGRFATLFDDPRLVNTHLDRLLAVTPDDVADVATRLLAPEARAELIYRAGVPDADAPNTEELS